MAARIIVGVLLGGLLLALGACQAGGGTSSAGHVQGFYGSVGGGWNQQ